MIRICTVHQQFPRVFVVYDEYRIIFHRKLKKKKIRTNVKSNRFASLFDFGKGEWDMRDAYCVHSADSCKMKANDINRKDVNGRMGLKGDVVVREPFLCGNLRMFGSREITSLNTDYCGVFPRWDWGQHCSIGSKDCPCVYRFVSEIQIICPAQHGWFKNLICGNKLHYPWKRPAQRALECAQFVLFKFLSTEIGLGGPPWFRPAQNISREWKRYTSISYESVVRNPLCHKLNVCLGCRHRCFYK